MLPQCGNKGKDGLASFVSELHEKAREFGINRCNYCYSSGALINQMSLKPFPCPSPTRLK
jgi:hypothetical protein